MPGANRPALMSTWATTYAILNIWEAWGLACESPSAFSTILPINCW